MSKIINSIYRAYCRWGNLPMKSKLSPLIIVTLLVSCCSGIVSTLQEDLTGSVEGQGTGAINQHSYTWVVKPTDSGPYTVGYTDASVPRPSMSNLLARIFYPATSTGQDTPSDPSGGPYPAITWAPGAGGHYDDYDNLGTFVASWGFVMAICDFPTGSLNQVTIDSHGFVLDHLVAENSDSGSNFFGSIDVNMFGASGHSNGGWGAIHGTVADSRFKAVCTLAAAGNADGSDVNGLVVPIQLIVGSNDNTFKPVSQANYANADPIKSLIEIVGATHSGPFHLEYFISFFKFWLDGDQEYYTFIYGNDIQQDVTDGTIHLSRDLGLTTSADASKLTVEEDEEFTFMGQGIISNPDPPNRIIVRYEWDYDDDGTFDWNSTSTGSVSFIPYEDGVLLARFRVTDSWGLTATSESISVTVNNKEPIAHAGEDRTVNEDEVVLLDGRGSSDTPSDLVNLSYSWDFGNDEHSGWMDEPTINYTYVNTGIYTVTLTVKDDDFETDEASVQIVVNNVEPTCTAMADLQTVNEDEIINFSGAGDDSPSDMPSLNYYWDFGDDDQSEQMGSPNTTHAYTNKGIYNATLTIEDDNGVKGYSTFTINVNNVKPTCSAIVENQIVNEDEVLDFGGIVSDSPSDIASIKYKWDFDDGNDSGWDNIIDTTHIYENEGIYIATLSVKDDNDEIETDTVSITVNNIAPTVEADSSKTTVVEDEIVRFEADDVWDTDSDIDSVWFMWVFGDGSIAEGEKVSHAYVNANEYTVTLTATDDNGATGTDTLKITVNNVKPTAVITVNKKIASVGEELTFDGYQSSDTTSDKANLTYTWDFGDGEAGTGIAVNHTYIDSQQCTVTLMVSDSECTASTSMTITVIDQGRTDSGIDGNDTSAKVKKAKDDDNSMLIVGILAVLIVPVIALIAAVMILIRKKAMLKRSPWVQTQMPAPIHGGPGSAPYSTSVAGTTTMPRGYVTRDETGTEARPGYDMYTSYGTQSGTHVGTQYPTQHQLLLSPPEQHGDVKYPQEQDDFGEGRY